MQYIINIVHVYTNKKIVMVYKYITTAGNYTIIVQIENNIIHDGVYLYRMIITV